MGRQYTALGSCLGHQEEVIQLVALLVAHDVGIDDRATWRVHHLRLRSLLKESLVDALVYNYESHFRHGQWELFLHDLFQHDDLLVDNLIPHGITDTITVDDHVLDVVLVDSCVLSECIGVALLHVRAFSNLLALFLIIDLGEVFGKLCIQGGTEAED